MLSLQDSFQWKKHAIATKCLEIWQIWLSSIPHFEKKPKIILSIHKLSTCTFVWWRFIPEISSLLLLPSYALLLCPWHWRKIRNITTWKSTERARALSLSLTHSLTSSKNKNPNFCMKMKYLRHTCSLQYGDVGRRADR